MHYGSSGDWSFDVSKPIVFRLPRKFFLGGDYEKKSLSCVILLLPVPSSILRTPFACPFLLICAYRSLIIDFFAWIYYFMLFSLIEFPLSTCDFVSPSTDLANNIFFFGTSRTAPVTLSRRLPLDSSNRGLSSFSAWS